MNTKTNAALRSSLEQESKALEARLPEAVAEALVDDGLFNPVAVGRLVDKFRVKPDGGFRDNAALVGILSTRLWLQRFAARPARRAEAA